MVNETDERPRRDDVVFSGHKRGIVNAATEVTAEVVVVRLEMAVIAVENEWLVIVNRPYSMGSHIFPVKYSKVIRPSTRTPLPCNRHRT